MKTLPFNTENVIDYERCLLGAYIEGAPINDKMKAAVFYSTYHKTMYPVIRELKTNNIDLDISILTTELKKKNLLEKAGGFAYIANLTPALTANTEFYENEILSAYKARVLYQSTIEAKQKLEEGADYDSVISELTTAQDSLLKADTKKQKWHRKTALQIINEEYPPLYFVVPGIIPEGVSKIDGAPKVGKSWLALNLGVAVAHGGYFMNRKVEQGEVLILALEDNERRIKDRLLKMGGLANDKLFIETPHTWKGGIETLKEYLNEYPNTILIIIDTLYKFFPKIQDTNDYSETYKPMSILQELASLHRVSVVLIHHTRKTVGESWQDNGLGSQGINGGVDTIIQLTKPDGKESGTLRVRGRDVEEKCFEVVFDKDIMSWRIIREGEPVKEEPKAQAEILELIEEHGGLKASEIASMLGKSKPAISNLLKKLKEKDLIYADSGKYSLFHDSSQMNDSE